MGDRGKAGDLLVVDGDGRKLVASLDQSDGCSCLPPSSWGRWFPPTHPTNDSTTHQLLRLAAATEDRIGAMECASTKYGTPKFYNEQGGEAAPGLHGGASTGKFAAVKEQKKMLATGKSGRRHAKRHSAAASSCDKDHDFFRYPGRAEWLDKYRWRVRNEFREVQPYSDYVHFLQDRRNALWF